MGSGHEIDPQNQKHRFQVKSLATVTFGALTAVEGGLAQLVVGFEVAGEPAFHLLMPSAIGEGLVACSRIGSETGGT